MFRTHNLNLVTCRVFRKTLNILQYIKILRYYGPYSSFQVFEKILNGNCSCLTGNDQQQTNKGKNQVSHTNLLFSAGFHPAQTKCVFFVGETGVIQGNSFSQLLKTPQSVSCREKMSRRKMSLITL